MLCNCQTCIFTAAMRQTPNGYLAMSANSDLYSFCVCVCVCPARCLHQPLPVPLPAMCVGLTTAGSVVAVMLNASPVTASKMVVTVQIRAARNVPPVLDVDYDLISVILIDAVYGCREAVQAATDFPIPGIHVDAAGCMHSRHWPAGRAHSAAASVTRQRVRHCWACFQTPNCYIYGSVTRLRTGIWQCPHTPNG